MDTSFINIYEKFDIDLKHYNYGNGHINDTYIITESPKYILQRINTTVFKDPVGVMNNIEAVTQHIKQKLVIQGRNPEYETLTVIKTVDGKNFYLDENGNYFRLFKFIDGAISYDTVSSPEILYSAAKAFGEFQNMLSDFPAGELNETIQNFHNTPWRVDNLKKAIADDKVCRVKEVKDEIDFVMSYEDEASKVVKGIENGTIPLRVTHNDTKINNVLIDPLTGKGVAVIDLDTVMPGSLLYDFGDGLRTGGAMAAEDETDLTKVGLNLELFEGFTKGFLDGIGDNITDAELELLPYSVFLLTYECGTRFLTDYIEGDVYFKIHRPMHNLDRARTQFAMCKDIISKYEIMNEIVKKASKK